MDIYKIEKYHVWLMEMRTKLKIISVLGSKWMKFMSIFRGLWDKEKDENFNNFFLNFILVNFLFKIKLLLYWTILGIDYV